MNYIKIFYCSLLFFLVSCNNKEESNKNANTLPTAKNSDRREFNVEFAKGFSVEYIDSFKLVTVHEPWKNAPHAERYLLIPKGSALPDHDNDVKVIEIPLQSIASLSTTHIPFLELLNEHHKLSGFATTDFISSPEVRKLVNKGKVRDLGPDGSINLEVLAEISPDAIMAFGTGSNTGLFNKVNQMGIPVILNADYLENSALGRAEWIKFTSLFFNKEKEADSIFNEIKTRYDSLKSLAQNKAEQPTVYSGIVYGNIWYVPAGKSWAAELIEHAGGDYLWEGQGKQGSLELSFESVYEKGAEADYWIGVASFNDLQEIKKADERYTNFKAFKEGNVYSYNARMGEKGGNEYMELGYARPDIILADLIKVLHPELLPDHQLYFYKKLPEQSNRP